MWGHKKVEAQPFVPKNKSPDSVDVKPISEENPNIEKKTGLLIADPKNGVSEQKTIGEPQGIFGKGKTGFSGFVSKDAGESEPPKKGFFFSSPNASSAETKTTSNTDIPIGPSSQQKKFVFNSIKKEGTPTEDKPKTPENKEVQPSIDITPRLTVNFAEEISKDENNAPSDQSWSSLSNDIKSIPKRAKSHDPYLQTSQENSKETGKGFIKTNHKPGITNISAMEAAMDENKNKGSKNKWGNSTWNGVKKNDDFSDDDWEQSRKHRTKSRPNPPYDPQSMYPTMPQYPSQMCPVQYVPIYIPMPMMGFPGMGMPMMGYPGMPNMMNSKKMKRMQKKMKQFFEYLDKNEDDESEYSYYSDEE